MDYTALSLPAAFAAGASTLHLSIAPLPDSLAEGNETIILTLTPGAGYSLGAGNPATVTLADRPYDAWRFANGIAAVSPTADLDGDGFVTLLEYGVGSNPNVPARPTYPQVTRTSGELRLTYQRLQPATEIFYRSEVSSDLVNWEFGSGFSSPAI